MVRIKGIYMLLMVTLLFVTQIGYSQIATDTLRTSYHDVVSGEDLWIISYTYTNISNENYFTWVNIDPVNSFETERKMINMHFLYRKGEFSFVDLYSDCLLRKNFDCLEVDFLKRIRPNESFIYTIVKTSRESTTYEERIAVVEEEKIKHLFDPIEGNASFEICLYGLSQIILLDNFKVKSNPQTRSRRR